MFFTIPLANAELKLCSDPTHLNKSQFQNISKNNTVDDNQLIIYSVNPPKPIDWSTPGKALQSIVKNAFKSEGYYENILDYNGEWATKWYPIKSHFIGHMFIELNCRGYDSLLTGMTSKGDEEIRGLFLDGKSFTQIISPTKGFFNSYSELKNEIDARKSKVGNLNFLGINLTQNSCESLLSYLAEFKACGIVNRYGGLNANPLKAEGAGCSAFALSFLQKLKIIKDISHISSNDFGKQFIREIIIPKNMLKTKLQNPKIGAWGLLKGKNIQWGSNEIDGLAIKFFDPELFSKWVQSIDYKTEIPGLIFSHGDHNKIVNGFWYNEISLDPDTPHFSIEFLK